MRLSPRLRPCHTALATLAALVSECVPVPLALPAPVCRACKTALCSANVRKIAYLSRVIQSGATGERLCSSRP